MSMEVPACQQILCRAVISCFLHNLHSKRATESLCTRTSFLSLCQFAVNISNSLGALPRSSSTALARLARPAPPKL